MRFAAILWVHNTCKDLSGISHWNALRDMLRGLNRDSPTAVCEWAVPWRQGSITWPQDYFADPWIRTHPCLPDKIATFDHPPIGHDAIEPFLPRKGEVLIDFLLNRNMLHSPAIANAFYVPPNRWYQQIEVPVVTWYTETALDVRLPTLATKWGLVQTAASVATTPTIVLNDYDRDYLLEIVEEHGPRSTGDISRNVYVVNPVADLDQVDKLLVDFEREREKRAGTKKVVLFHGGSFESKRRLGVADDVIHEINGLTGRFLSQKDTKRNPFGEQVWLTADVRHNDYVKSFGEGDVLFVGTEYEGTGLAYVEAIRSGMIPVVYDAPWMVSRLPRDYPFKCKTKEDLALMLRQMVEGLPEIKAEWQAKLIEAMNPFTPAVAAIQFQLAIDEIMFDVREKNFAVVRKVQPAYDLLAQAVGEEQWEEIDGFEMLHKAMYDRSKKKVWFRYVTPLALRWMMLDLGYDDTNELEFAMVKK